VKNKKIVWMILLLMILCSISIYANPNSGTYTEQNTGYKMFISGGKGIKGGYGWGTVSVTADGATTTGTWIDYNDKVVISFDKGFLSGKKATYNLGLNKLTGNGETWTK
jgi:hypothetical protein